MTESELSHMAGAV